MWTFDLLLHDSAKIVCAEGSQFWVCVCGDFVLLCVSDVKVPIYTPHNEVEGILESLC